MERRARVGGPSRAAPTGAGRTAPNPGVKVTHILTRKVSADEASFKDVVQRLTGKDSAAARLELLGDCNPVTRTTAQVAVAAGVSGQNSSDRVEATGGGAAGVLHAVSLFEDMMAADGLPSLEEMNSCWWSTRD